MLQPGKLRDIQQVWCVVPPVGRVLPQASWDAAQEIHGWTTPTPAPPVLSNFYEDFLKSSKLLGGI